MMRCDNEVCFYKGNFIEEFRYSVNDEVFYYNVFTSGEINKVYKYSKKEHEEIQNLKMDIYWLKAMDK